MSTDSQTNGETQRVTWINGAVTAYQGKATTPSGAAIAVVPATYRADPTRVPELWLIPSGGKPLPLGVLLADRPTQIAIPAAIADQVKRGAALAISLEPPGGSPASQPSGPVIGSGTLTNL